MNANNMPVRLTAALIAALLLCSCSQAPTPAAAANVSDSDVTEHVKTALQQRDSLKRFDITVVTLKGDVRLAGVLDSQAQIDEALAIARAADGAHTIHDELTLRK
ncbi:BON domain-containing protein [Paucibacter sp. JuS9]|uniref:BON domain-containing protein n=1 Tax=Paucibacter sp. JuS9 TaxID=3228748 RepID=UPI0037583645